MDNSVAAKACDVDSENACHAVNLHRRDETRVVNLYAYNDVRYHESLPLLINGRAVRQNAEVSFQQAHAPLGGLDT